MFRVPFSSSGDLAFFQSVLHTVVRVMSIDAEAQTQLALDALHKVETEALQEWMAFPNPPSSVLQVGQAVTIALEGKVADWRIIPAKGATEVLNTLEEFTKAAGSGDAETIRRCTEMKEYMKNDEFPTVETAIAQSAAAAQLIGWLDAIAPFAAVGVPKGEEGLDDQVADSAAPEAAAEETAEEEAVEEAPASSDSKRDEMLQAALAAIEEMSPNQLAELRALPNPPPVVITVGCAVVLAINDERTWDAMSQLLADRSTFQKKLENFSRGAYANNDDALQGCAAARDYIEAAEDFPTVKKAHQYSAVASAFVKWLGCIVYFAGDIKARPRRREPQVEDTSAHDDGAGQVIEQPVIEEQPAEAAPAEPPEAQQEEAEEPQVISDDVALEYENHFFTKADVVDVTKIQAIYRRQASRKKVDDAKLRKQELEKQRKERLALRTERIELPEDDEDELAAAKAAEEAAAAEKKKGIFGRVDHSKKLKIEPMSADTKGMQRMYSRMLKTKMWW